ncbi:MAG: hypothetical protein JRJ39_05265 [Deltaproteobacteria bacterium]|nr:hypothetical protein [Deltaproteobacteria bacterium]
MCTGCCATSPAIAKGVDAADVIISIRSTIIIQHMVFSLDTLYIRSFWHGFCDEIRLWAVFKKGGDIHACTCLPVRTILRPSSRSTKTGLSGSMAFIVLMSGR